MWETVASIFVANGGTLILNAVVNKLDITKTKVDAVHYTVEGETPQRLSCTDVISTMPIKDLVAASKDRWTERINQTALQRVRLADEASGQLDLYSGTWRASWPCPGIQ